MLTTAGREQANCSSGSSALFLPRLSSGFYRMQLLMNIFNDATCIVWLVIYSSASTSETWEKKPILIQRKNPDYYTGLFSTSEFDRILREVIHPLLMSNLIWCNDSIRHAWVMQVHSSLCFLLVNVYLSNWNSVFIIQEDVQYGVNLDVTSYTNCRRETHNPPGRALPYSAWGFYKVRPLWYSFVYNMCVTCDVLPSWWLYIC